MPLTPQTNPAPARRAHRAESPRPRHPHRAGSGGLQRLLLGVATLLTVGAPALAAAASLGLTRLPAAGDSGPVTVFYPSEDASSPVRTGWFLTPLAQDGRPGAGNGRLIVISHGSGGGPWVHLDLTRELVDAGFVVAFPQHQGDHSGDPSRPGPESWTRRPGEVSHAIDAVLADPRWSGRLAGQRVGLYGYSAGGHTALSLAGGRWSPARFAQHCQVHLREDFPACVGLATQLTGSWLDPVRLQVAHWVIDGLFADDTQLREDHDPHLAAIVAAAPAAADMDADSLHLPRVPLGLVNALQDRWLAPRWHGLRIRDACSECEDLGTLPAAGHGVGLSPQPPVTEEPLHSLLADPPGFDRPAELPALHRRVREFFARHLGVVGASGHAQQAALQ